MQTPVTILPNAGYKHVETKRCGSWSLLANRLTQLNIPTYLQWAHFAKHNLLHLGRQVFCHHATSPTSGVRLVYFHQLHAQIFKYACNTTSRNTTPFEWMINGSAHHVLGLSDRFMALLCVLVRKQCELEKWSNKEMSWLKEYRQLLPHKSLDNNALYLYRTSSLLFWYVNFSSISNLGPCHELDLLSPVVLSAWCSCQWTPVCSRSKTCNKILLSRTQIHARVSCLSACLHTCLCLSVCLAGHIFCNIFPWYIPVYLYLFIQIYLYRLTLVCLPV